MLKNKLNLRKPFSVTYYSFTFDKKDSRVKINMKLFSSYDVKLFTFFLLFLNNRKQIFKKISNVSLSFIYNFSPVNSFIYKSSDFMILSNE